MGTAFASGTSDTRRIVYQAAPGKKVVIKGSEPVTEWEKEKNDTWMVVIPNKIFGGFNPYSDQLDNDYSGASRNTANPDPGPFGFTSGSNIRLKVWPK